MKEQLCWCLHERAEHDRSDANMCSICQCKGFEFDEDATNYILGEH